MRNTKTDYVSCPSCGRTLFDLQEVTDQIRQKTGHLPGGFEWLRSGVEQASFADLLCEEEKRVCCYPPAWSRAN